MPAGYFYQPRNLLGLDEAALKTYAEVCRATIVRAEQGVLRIEGKLEILASGRRKGAILNYGGLGFAVIGIATTALFTPLGFLALAGGVMAFAGAEDTAARGLRRSQLVAELEDKRRSIAFCRSEQTRIADELRIVRSGRP